MRRMPKQHAKRYFAIEVIWKPSGATDRCLVEDTVGLGGDDVGVIVEGTAFEIDGPGKPVAEKIKSTTVHRIELDEFKKEFASQKWKKVSLPLGTIEHGITIWRAAR